MIELENPDVDLLIPESSIDDEKMVEILAEKVQAYLDYNIGLLMSYLYRLDVSEKSIKDALLNAEEDAGHIAIARLIWKRQKQRLKSKNEYKIDQNIDEDLAW